MAMLTWTGTSLTNATSELTESSSHKSLTAAFFGWVATSVADSQLSGQSDSQFWTSWSMESLCHGTDTIGSWSRLCGGVTSKSHPVAPFSPSQKNKFQALSSHSPVGFLWSAPAPKWAPLALNLCTQHCGWAPHIHVLHQNCASTRVCTVLAVSNCIEYGGTSYAVLKRVEVELWCGMCRCDTGTQCWVHRVNVKAAYFVARVLKRETTRGGPCQTE